MTLDKIAKLEAEYIVKAASDIINLAAKKAEESPSEKIPPVLMLAAMLSTSLTLFFKAQEKIITTEKIVEFSDRVNLLIRDYCDLTCDIYTK